MQSPDSNSSQPTPLQPSTLGTEPAKKGMSGGVKLLIGCAVLVPLLVCCVGVLSATAIPAFLGFTLRAKTVEAGTTIAVLAESTRARCEQGLPAVGAGPLPATPSSDKQMVDFTADSGFAALGFNPGVPLYYRYSVVPLADGNTAIRAEGDLDGDGTLSLFEVTCAPTCQCSAMYIERETE